MNWIILIVAGLFESGFAFCLGKMKEVSGTAWWLWGAGFILCLTMSMVLLAKAVKTIPIGTAYPIWTGIGAVCTVILGIIFFHESASFLRLFFITTLIISARDAQWLQKSQQSEELQHASNMCQIFLLLF